MPRKFEIDPLWKQLKPDYKLLEEMGQGSYGQVLKAQNRKTKELVAIKLMKNIFSDEYSARKTLREIKILRKLSQVPNNLFTTKLLELILPENLKNKKDSLLPSIIEEEKVPFDDGVR